MNDDSVDPQVLRFLEDLKPVAGRHARSVARGRARFLSEAVSAGEKRRHSLWNIFPKKEQLVMKLIMSTLVIVGLLFGGNATVAAAQDDLPDQSLYQIKLMSEEVHLWFISDPVRQIEMLMQQAQNRVQEMEALTLKGVTPPAEVGIRAQERIQLALQIAAQLDEPTHLAVLQQMQTRLKLQEQQMLQLEQGTCTECIPVLQQTREMLQLRLREMEDKLGDPGPVQNQDQTRNQMQDQNQLQINQTPQPMDNLPSPCGTCTPALDGTGLQNGGGIVTAAAPQQQNQNNQHGSGSGGAQNGGTSGGGGTQGGKP